MFKVLIAEDEKWIRQGLRALIEDLTSDFDISGEAIDGEKALELIRLTKPDVLLTDIRMPKMNGLTLIKKAKELFPSLLIVIISGYDDFEYAKSAIQFGVQDYLLKPINRKEFVKAMEALHHTLNENINNLELFSQHDNPDIQKINLYIWNNMDQEITLSTVADLVHLHPGYFSQWFKKETSINFSEYVTNLRIKKAKQLLTETELKVYEVAELAGYQNEKYFLKTFKKNCNQTPSTYRKQMKNKTC